MHAQFGACMNGGSGMQGMTGIGLHPADRRVRSITLINSCCLGCKQHIHLGKEVKRLLGRERDTQREREWHAPRFLLILHIRIGALGYLNQLTHESFRIWEWCRCVHR